MYVVAANAATDDPDTVCNITVINNRYLAIIAYITSAESSTSGRCCMYILCSVNLGPIVDSGGLCCVHCMMIKHYIQRACIALV